MAVLRADGVEWTNLEARSYYLNEEARIGDLNKQWRVEGIPARERAYRAWQIRKNARVTARAMMPDKAQVEQLREGDKRDYGDPDGPTFEWLENKARADGQTDDGIYEYIIEGSQRSRSSVNRSLNHRS